MLAKLTELAGQVDLKPRGEDRIYPAPWEDATSTAPAVPHMVHLSDNDLIRYLGQVPVADSAVPLQRRLYQALRYRRNGLYRTLLVIDSDLAHRSPGEIGSFARCFRGNDGRDRIALELELSRAAGVEAGDVLVYCPDPHMQSKEVDARMEIQEGRILPLRLQRESFAYSDDLKVLQQYYAELWCAYIFVAPSLYSDESKCRAVVDHICAKLHMPKEVAYKKVRGFAFQMSAEEASARALEVAGAFIRDLPFSQLSQEVTGSFIQAAGADEMFVGSLVSRGQDNRRLAAIFEVESIRHFLRQADGDGASIAAEALCEELLNGSRDPSLPRSGPTSFASYQASVMAALKTTDGRVKAEILPEVGAAATAAYAMSKDEIRRQLIKDEIRRQLINFGQRFRQPHVAAEWNTNLGALTDCLADLQPSELRQKLTVLDNATLEQTELLSARFTVDQLMKLVSPEPPKQKRPAELF